MNEKPLSADERRRADKLLEDRSYRDALALARALDQIDRGIKETRRLLAKERTR